MTLFEIILLIIYTGFAAFGYREIKLKYSLYLRKIDYIQGFTFFTIGFITLLSMFIVF